MKKYTPYIALTAAIMLPLMLPGYIFMLDMVFTPDLPRPAIISHDYLWHLLLFTLDSVLPSQLIQKAILVSIPLLAAIGMHRLIEYIAAAENEGQNGAAHLSWYWATYLAGVFYAVNPFTYTRFMAGQYAVLLGYALLPFFVRTLLHFLVQPDRRALAAVVGLSLAASAISLHALGLLVVITASFSAIAIWQRRKNRRALVKYLQLGLAGAGLFILLSSYWLIPLLAGQGETAQTMRHFDGAHAEAFATAGNSPAARVYNVLHLQGFWLDQRGQYLLPQNQLPGWGTIRLAVLALAAWGFLVCWRRKRTLAASLLALTAAGTTLAVGFPATLLTATGYREPHKFAALIALALAIAIAFGSSKLLHRVRQHSEARYGITASVLLLIVLLFTPTMYWGFGGQLTPRQYPKEWQQTQQYLQRQPGNSRTLFLPWHQYMSFEFAGRIIASPAELYFGPRVIASHDPEIGRITPHQGITRSALGALLSQRPKPQHFARQLTKHNVQFILLAKDFDYKKYEFLRTQPGLVIEKDTPVLRLYRNTFYKEPR